MISESSPPFGTAAVRFHCAECERFDLCEACHAAADHPHHLWQEVREQGKIPTGSSMASLVLATFDRFRDRWCFGTRRRDDSNNNGGGGQSRWHWQTFGQVRDKVERLACGLRHQCGILPRSRVGICGPTSEDWLVVDLALMVTNCMSVPLDPAGSDADIARVINLAQLSGVVCSAELAERFASIAADCAGLTLLVVWGAVARDHVVDVGAGVDDSVVATDPLEHLALPPHVSATTLVNVVMGGVGFRFDNVVSKAAPSDIVTVIFSSGSTGRPKGVQLSDAVFRRRVSGITFPLDPFVVVAYMPMCHSFERMNTLSTFIAGGRAAFHDGPVSDILRTCQEIRPTTFSSTPRLWNVLYQDFGSAMRSVAPGKTTREDILGSKRNALGGRTKHVGTGGAYTRPEVVEFLRECFSCSVFDGFGATETGGLLWDGESGRNVQTRLVDCPELGYLTADVPFPRGELCVSSDQMSDGCVHAISFTPACT